MHCIINLIVPLEARVYAIDKEDRVHVVIYIYY